MKKTYTKKQITEAITYWKRRLAKMNESYDTGVPADVRKAMDEFRNADGLWFHGTCSFETEDSQEFTFEAKFPDGVPTVREVFMAAVGKARGQRIDFDPQTYKDFVLYGDFHTRSLGATFALCYEPDQAADASMDRNCDAAVVFEDDSTPHGYFVVDGEPASGF